MELQNVMIAPCMGWVPAAPHTCEALVLVRLDKGTSAYRCPRCSAIHVVDPLRVGTMDFEMEGSMLGNTEFERHWIETFSGPIAQRISASVDKRGGEGERFIKAKVGKLRQAFVGEQFAASPPARPPQAMVSIVEKLDAAIRAGTVSQSDLPLEMKRLYDAYEIATDEMRRDPGQAVPLFRQIVARYPAFAAARANFAAALVSSGQPREALQHVSFAHSLIPFDADLHITAARAHEALADIKSAIEQYLQALRDEPSHVGARNGLGAIYGQMGAAQLAERWLLAALIKTQAEQRNQMPPGHAPPQDLPSIFANLAQVYEDVGIWEGAADCWQQAVSLEPGNTTYGQRQQRAEHFLNLVRWNSDVSVSTYRLDELDPTGVARISFRSATSAETDVRSQQVFGSSVHAYASGVAQLTSMVPRARRQEIECQLTICGIEGAYRGDKPLFVFNESGALAMTDDEFHDAWRLLPPKVAGLFHTRCLETNPQWGVP